MGRGQQVECLAVDKLHPTLGDEGTIIIGINAWGSCEDDAVIVHARLHGLDHRG
jgi:hypothetical protein